MKVFTYTKPERFAVCRKLPVKKRHYANFKNLYTDRAAAETEALRLAEIHKPAQFYVIEIHSVTNHG